ncbi:MAG: hypothetical protein LC099_03810 [Anaerolineales bacterium]|nr:hypothetical protein [Anaerolineales bacterium]
MNQARLTSRLQSFRGEMKKSRFKIWLRALLLTIFSALFCAYFIRDIANGHFNWASVALTFAALVPVGFWLSRLVPMQADENLEAVTLSLDSVYLVLIWILVVAKIIFGQIPALVPASDFVMASILGIMFGRLSGIGLRVRQLKMQHGLTENKNQRVASEI